MGRERMKKAFSLVELAIVLVIIGLLIAGITAGSTLKEQAALRAVIAEMKKYQAGYAAFVDLYKMPPGDFNQAQAIWGSNCSITVTCNGNGNNRIESFANSSSETLRAWKHLELAELLDTSVPVVPSTWSGNLPLSDIPRSKLNGGYFMAAGDIYITGATYITSPFGNDNAVFTGKEKSGYAPTIGIMTGLQAYNLDSKFDDGKINTSGNPSGNSTGVFRATNDANGGTNCISGGGYNILSLVDACLVGYKLDRNSDG